MKNSTNIGLVVLLVTMFTALSGCVVGYPYHGGYAHGRNYGGHPHGRPYYGYSGYRGGGYGAYGHRHHHNRDDDD